MRPRRRSWRWTSFLLAASSLLAGAVLAGKATEPRSTSRSYELKGEGGLRVRVEYQTLTGQWHLADRLTISLGGGPPLVRRSVENSDGGLDGDPAPLMEEVYPAGPGRWVLLGWSSLGEGLHRNYAWVVEAAPPGLLLADRLEHETDRSSAGLALEISKAALRIGLPRPQEDVHRPGEWQLVVGGRSLGLGEIRRLRYGRWPPGAVRKFYAPPAGLNTRTRGWKELAWFELKDGVFSEARP